ncbi:hypothetical protein HNO88_002822 [Novosphingobium chloroacetimidivorans]|uniref:Right-handed parallel beta-helix repeat-containing protein n=1 Tax=Novosphingobium chloroacetimidivorans TaxID=1428314 RepID=A0A7W7NWF1_9SPHN|nr:right-handed parallel beta-helix repeat-containing protein [Novosphingobium chloroacetimidivorans]MBB4859493.1 hypothetical protein [Novosphingobium chloroacetimidivorans]
MQTPDDKRLIGRRPLLGGLAAAAALAPTGAPAAPMTPSQEQLGSLLQVATRAQLAALDGSPGQAALLTEPGRQGFFVLREGAAPGQDPLQGLTIPSERGSRHWARMWDGSHGMPEWFGARANDRSAAATNRAAIEACIALCPITQLAQAEYLIADTLRVSISNRTLRGTNFSAEPPYNGGTRVVCTDPRRDVIRVGGTPNAIPSIIHLEALTACWSVDLVPPPTGREAEAPAAFRVEHVLTSRLERCFALDPLIGFWFNGAINTRCIGYGVTRFKGYRGGGRDFVRGVWVRGKPRRFAGGNASLYLMDGNVSTSEAMRAAFYMPMGIYADADFADLYILGLETFQIAFPITLDGAGGDFSGGHGDVHIRSLVIDQIIGDGITIRNTNPLAKIQIDGGYIQIVDSRQDNKGLWLENGGGAITVSNLQITGEDSSSTSIGIYAKNRANVAISDSVIVENIAFPVRVERGCARLSLGCTVNGGVMRSRGHAAIAVDGASQSVLRPKLTGNPGAFTAGVELLGSVHDRVSIDPTMVDPMTVPSGRKVVINGKAVTASGHYSGNGDRAPEGAGVMVSGVVG